MRLLTGADILSFYNGRNDLLALAETGDYLTVDRADLTGRTDAYSTTTTHEGTEVTVLLERETIDDGEWFEGALDDDGDLRPEMADEMAATINSDAGLNTRVAVAEIHETTEAWSKSSRAANRLANKRAVLIDDFVRQAGSQSAAARLLGLDQSTVNKLVKKAQQIRPCPPIPDDVPILVTDSFSSLNNAREHGIDEATQWWVDACHRTRLHDARVTVMQPGRKHVDEEGFLTVTLPADDEDDTKVTARYALDIARELVKLLVDPQDADAIASLKELLGSDSPMAGQSQKAWHKVINWMDMLPVTSGQRLPDLSL